MSAGFRLFEDGRGELWVVGRSGGWCARILRLLILDGDQLWQLVLGKIIAALKLYPGIPGPGAQDLGCPLGTPFLVGAINLAVMIETVGAREYGADRAALGLGRYHDARVEGPSSDPALIAWVWRRLPRELH